MIIPSIDLLGGQAVQLIGGKEMAIEAGDPRPIARRFAVAGEIAVVDLDAALGRGNNEALIEELIRLAPCRVGGGIRDVERAKKWLSAGATKVVLGTKAVPEILRELPRDRVIAALDAVHGEVVVEGWTAKTGRSIGERMKELEGLVGGFLVTFVEREGRLGGIDLAEVERLVELSGDAELTIAGGVTTRDDVRALDRLGADAQVGMALYTGRLKLADAISAPLIKKAPWPAVVTDARGTALRLLQLTQVGLQEIVERGRVGTRELLRIDLDDERESLRLISAGEGATAWGPKSGFLALLERLEDRQRTMPEGSYTRRLLEDPKLLEAKLIEEAGELAHAASREEATWEAADLLYFLAVALVRSGAKLSEVEALLDRRALEIQRRQGEAKR